MVTSHPFARELLHRVEARAAHRISLKARTILRGFGYERRTARIVSEIVAELQTLGMVTPLSMEYPRMLDQRVHISALRLPEQPISTALSLDDDVSDMIEVAAAALPATVRIASDNSVGSGFIVHRDGLVVTARHVCDEDGLVQRHVEATVAAGTPQQRIVMATVFRAHRQLDFALLWLHDAGPFPTVTFGSPQQLQHAEDVLAIGCPSGIVNTVSRGIISNPRAPFRGIEFIQTDAALDPGNSGGPLLNRAGVVGVSAWIIDGVGAAKFALPIDYLDDEIARAAALGKAACLSADFCRACGAYSLETPTWYCRSCGRRSDSAAAIAPQGEA